MSEQTPEGSGLNIEHEGPYISRLALTAEAHKAIGSSGVDERLVNNPGKTLGELLSDQELGDYLNNHQQKIAELSKPEFANDPFSQSMLDWRRQELSASIQYLTQINRLPKAFQIEP